VIRLIKSTFYDEAATKRRLTRFLRSATHLSLGPECAAFETEFARWQGRRSAVLVNSGSSANLALLQALVNLGRLVPGDRVGVSAVTWATNVMPLITLGLHPVPIDIDLETLNISSRTVRAAYQAQPFQCLFVTNLLGLSGDLEAIQAFCAESRILLLEDNCESLGTEYLGTKLGNFGTASTFSFFVGHHLSTIEGGMVCTDDAELASMMRMVRSHGWDRHLSSQEQTRLRTQHGVDDFDGKYTFYDIGYNLRPTEVQGFLGQDQLRYLPAIISARQENYQRLAAIYQNTDFVALDTSRLTVHSNFAFPLICQTRAHRDRYLRKAESFGIETRPIVGGNIVTQVFFRKYAPMASNVPHAEHVHACGFYVGNNPDLTTRELDRMISTFAHAD
jgi:CDP-6-deoxy-D-xylo-4-hexulose-3-dehydrase